ncbi:hypothetical protein ACF3NR_11620 [Vaginella massiliensis]|uniref:hypothetical protein n=1 Tax=Vaginella massiliensis TaxID=1816680 RepID=UPI000838BFF9|nr:hypothetical protein [Vaginella massiliensis]
MEKIEKELHYKGHSTKIVVEVQQLPAFNPETMDKEKYEETKKVYRMMAEEEFYNRKTEWIFCIEKKLQEGDK